MLGRGADALLSNSQPGSWAHSTSLHRRRRMMTPEMQRDGESVPKSRSETRCWRGEECQCTSSCFALPDTLLGRSPGSFGALGMRQIGTRGPPHHTAEQNHAKLGRLFEPRRHEESSAERLFLGYIGKVGTFAPKSSRESGEGETKIWGNVSAHT